MATPIVQSVDRALDILEVLGKSEQGVRVKDLCDTLDMNKSTISRMLNTLAQRGYVEKMPNDAFRIGMRIVELSSVHLNSLQLKTEALPFMEDLKNRTGLIIHLGIMEDMEVVYLEKLSAYNNLRMYSQIGRRVYAHCTGLGKSMMAFMSEAEVRKILDTKGMPAVTEKTTTDEKKLFQKLDMIRKKGYALDEEENELGVRCVAAPVFDYRGNVIAAVSATGFIDSFPLDRVDTVAADVTDCTGKISKAMGYTKMI